MRHALNVLLVCGVCCLASAALYDVCYAEEGGKVSTSKSRGQLVKEAVEATFNLSRAVSGVTRDCSGLNWARIAGRIGYRITYSSDVEFPMGTGRFKARSMDWAGGRQPRSKPVTVLVVLGGKTPSDAQEKVFEIIGAETNVMIASSVYKVLKNGPGDLCIVAAGNVKEDDKHVGVIHKTWFVRDNVAIEVSCPGDTDLLPIARALDEAIRSCPEGAKGKDAN